MSAFPGALATFTGFTSSHTLAADNHAAQHNLEQAEILAAQTKVGVGSSTPTAGTVLRGTGAGSSGWGQASLTTDVSGVLPVANGGTGQASLSGLTLPSAILSNPTISGTVGGSATYTTPILSTPTIADFTSATHTHANVPGGGQLNGASAITDGTLTPAELVSGTGSSWAWQDWIPVLTDTGGGAPTVGNGVMVAKYIQTGKTIKAMMSLTLGTTTNFGSGDLIISLPANRGTWGGSKIPIGSYVLYDSSTGAVYAGSVYLFDSSHTFKLLVHSITVAGQMSAHVSGSAATPMGFAPPDTVSLTITYETP